MKRFVAILSSWLALVFGTAVTAADITRVQMQLNWAPGADHAPLYYALERGWFSEQGVDLRIVPGGGSVFTVDAVARGKHDLGIADLFMVMRAWSRGAEVTAVMNLFVNAPHAFYWLKESGIRGIADIPGRRIGTLPEDPARVLWRALARHSGLEAGSVVWIDMAHNMKVGALADGRIDVATNAFFHNHAGYESAFGDRLMSLPWRTLGFNLYSNSIIAHSAFLAREPGAVRVIVRTLQRAIGECLRRPEPCLAALLRANNTLDEAPTRRNWALVEALLRADDPDAVIGEFREARLRADHNVLETWFGTDTPFDPTQRAINTLIDPAETFATLH